MPEFHDITGKLSLTPEADENIWGIPIKKAAP
jgi:hypothetical protein